MAKGKVAVPTDAVKLSEDKSMYGNVSRVVPVGSGAEVYVRPETFSSKAGRGSRIVVRRTHVKASHKLGIKARGMKSCSGLRGCEFASCLTAGGITPPRSIKKACPTA